MATEYKTPDQIAEQYLLHLKGLKPNINTKQTDSDWWVRSRVVGGVVAGVYADQLKISNDPFPQSARRDAIEKHLYTQFNSGFTPATSAVGNVIVTGATGSTVTAGLQFTYTPNGNVYTATATVAFGSAASATIPVSSVSTGQNQNLLAGASLTISSAPAGVSSTATVDGNGLTDGRDIETTDEAAARVLTQIRTPLAGGKVSDYQLFALAADPSVTSANIIRFPFGFGTVGVVITAGTTDIDTALNNGDPVTLIPSAALVTTVQAYIDTQKILTDCATVMAPASVPVNVTVNVKFSTGTSSTVPAGQTLTQAQLVQREVQRAIYKTPPGGRQLGSSGYVVASEIEEVIDSNLSSTPYAQGNIATILLDRQVQNLSATGANLAILGNQIALPGTITVVEM